MITLLNTSFISHNYHLVVVLVRMFTIYSETKYTIPHCELQSLCGVGDSGNVFIL